MSAPTWMRETAEDWLAEHDRQVRRVVTEEIIARINEIPYHSSDLDRAVWITREVVGGTDE